MILTKQSQISLECRNKAKFPSSLLLDNENIGLLEIFVAETTGIQVASRDQKSGAA